MARLPQPGSDNGTWGDVLNDYLSESHNADGTLKDIPQAKITNLSGTLATKADVSSLAPVATSGSYADLTAKPTIPTTPAQVGAEPVGLSTTTKTGLNASYMKWSQTLAPWFKKLQSSPSTAKIAIIGDSTRDNSSSGSVFHTAVKSQMGSGQPLEGMSASNVLNFGYNGQLIAQITSVQHLADLTTASPDIWEASFGTNDLRATSLTENDMVTRLIAGVNAIRTAIPGVPGILTVPASWLTTDVSANGYVVPNSEAAAKSVIMRAAYLRLVDQWPDVIVKDDQEQVFGIGSLATSPFMGDQIHPNTSGYAASVTRLVAIIGRSVPTSQALIAAARASNPYDAWTVYGRELEDTSYYSVIAEALIQNVVTTGATPYVDFAYPGGQRANFKTGDIIELPGGVSFEVPTSFTASINGSTTRLQFNTGIVPTGSTAGFMRVVRRNRAIAADVYDVQKDRTWRYRRIGRIHTAGTQFMRIRELTLGAADYSAQPSSDEWPLTNQIGDKVYIDGYPSNPITLTGTGITNQGLELGASAGIPNASFAAYGGRMITIVGTHPDVTLGYRTTTVSITVSTTSDRTIVANGATVTITLPDPTTVRRDIRFTVKNINAASATVVSAGTSKTIDGAASQTLAQWATQNYMSDSTQWLIV